MKKALTRIRNSAAGRVAAKLIREGSRLFRCAAIRLRGKAALPDADLSRFDTVILFENRFGWNRILRQRPQQMAEHFPGNVLFLYHSDYAGDFRDAPNRIRQIRPNLFLVDFGCYRKQIMHLFSQHPNKYVMLYSTGYLPQKAADRYRRAGYRILFDYVDDIDRRLCGERLYRRLTQQFACVMHDPHAVIVTTATRLYENAKAENPAADVHLVTNGVNCEHFAKENYTIPSDLRPIRESYEMIVGYYGALASWFDYGLVAHLCRTEPKCAAVLLGVDYDGTLSASGLLELPNVFYLGKKDYNDLPDYVHFFDVCTIPFLINEITLSTSPVKLFEYMAAGKPVVTTRLPECEKYRSVSVASDADDFTAKIRAAHSRKNDPDILAQLKRDAAENTWDKKAQAVAQCLKP